MFKNNDYCILYDKTFLSNNINFTCALFKYHNNANYISLITFNVSHKC